jgi:hypothetical protein
VNEATAATDAPIHHEPASAPFLVVAQALGPELVDVRLRACRKVLLIAFFSSLSDAAQRDG